MMRRVDVTTLIATVSGALIAIAGTVMADMLRRRDNRHRYDFGERQRAYTAMLLALGDGLEGLRGVGLRDIPAEKLIRAAGDALSTAGLYVAREKFLMSAAPAVAEAGESAFDALIGVRDAVRGGAKTGTRPFHDAYHPYAEMMWRFRLAVRDDLGAPRLRIADLKRGDWSGRTDCDVCNPAKTATKTATKTGGQSGGTVEAAAATSAATA
jgi:hypothetical protein